MQYCTRGLTSSGENSNKFSLSLGFMVDFSNCFCHPSMSPFMSKLCVLKYKNSKRFNLI